MYFISQVGKHDCLFACLQMMLANYQHDKNYLFLKHEDKPYSYKEIIAVGECYNLSLLGVKIDSYDELFKCRHFPIIVTLKLKENIKHSVLLYRINKKRAYYYDPVDGKVALSLAEFEDVWTHNALVVNTVNKLPCPVKAPDFISLKDKVILPIFQLLSGLSLLAATYFVNKDSIIIFPTVFFALFAIFELLFRESLLRAMRRLDDALANYEIDAQKEDYFSFYEAVEKYRHSALTLTPNIIYTMLVTVFISSILILNGTINIVYIVLTFLFAAFEALFLNHYYEEKEGEIQKDENEVRRAESEDEFYHYARSAREKAYRLGLFKTIFNILGIALMLITIVLVMALSDVVNITYIVFYLCICIFMKNNFNKIFTFTKQEEKCSMGLAKIIHYLKIE